MPPADVWLTGGVMLVLALLLAAVANVIREELSVARVVRAWRERCRYGLAQHVPMRVITNARLVGVTATASQWAVVDVYHRCQTCGTQLNERHPTVEPLLSVPSPSHPP